MTANLKLHKKSTIIQKMNRTLEQQVVEAMYTAYGTGDIIEFNKTLSDDIEWIYHGTEEIHHAATYQGKNGVARFFENVNEHIDFLEFQPRQFISSGEMVVVLGDEKQKIKCNGEIFEQKWIQVYTVKHGLIVKMEEFSNTAYAVKMHTKQV